MLSKQEMDELSNRITNVITKMEYMDKIKEEIEHSKEVIDSKRDAVKEAVNQKYGVPKEETQNKKGDN